MARCSSVGSTSTISPDKQGAEWLVCSGCHTIIYGKEFLRAAKVCKECGRHAPLTATERLALLLDDGTVRLWQPILSDSDPLEFVDTKPYPDRLAEARSRTELYEAVVCARGEIGGHAVVVAAMDFRFLGGSLGAAAGEAITAACEAALRERTPLLLVTASGGARMQEGVISLMQMAKTSQAMSQLDEAGILTVSLITDPTFGGVAASFATLCDVIIAEPGARLGFAGPRVIEQTIRQTLPEGFQTAEFLLDHGAIDMITPREEIRSTLARLLSVASPRIQTDVTPAINRHSASGAPTAGEAAETSGRTAETAALRLPEAHCEDDPIVRNPALLAARDPWEVVRLARRLGRPTTLDYIAIMIDEFTELRGDRISSDCPALVCGLGRLDGRSVVVIGTQKGHSAVELSARGYGMPTPSGYRKAARIMRLAAKIGASVVTFVDTPGAYPGMEAEEQGQAAAIAENLRLMTGLPVPIVTVVTGEGGSGGALALAIADRVLICSNAVYSVISPEGCASILWKDPGNAPSAAAALQIDARALLSLGVVDGVVQEPGNGADNDRLLAGQAIRHAVTDCLSELELYDAKKLVATRRSRFRAFGASTAISVDVERDQGCRDTDLDIDHPTLLPKRKSA